MAAVYAIALLGLAPLRCRLRMCDTSSLPIAPLLPSVVDSLSENPNLVLQAPPGAGKTTAVPLALLDAADPALNGGTILVLEPRRVAARGAAMRMASLIGEPVGNRVGYSVRGEKATSQRTRVLAVTEGVLSRRLQSDPSLNGVSCILFDEFHERSVDADLCLALCREAQQALRPDLRLLVMSATLGGDLAPRVSRMLGGCPILTSEGRSYRVDVRYEGTRPLALAASARPRELTSDVADAIVRATTAVAAGDVLVFLPGEREIRGVERALNEGGRLPGSRWRVLPLYAALPLDKQNAAIRSSTEGSPDERRIILSTSIAESSLTISGVRLVVDCGLRRCSVYDSNTGMGSLVTRPISISSADQRKGRAGRVAEGTCIRLWSESEHLRLAAQAPPAIEEADLAGTVLQLARWGCVSDAQITSLPWLTSPPEHAVQRARLLLYRLGALSRTAGSPGDEKDTTSDTERATISGDGAGGLAGGETDGAWPSSPDELQVRRGDGLALTRRGKALAALPTHPRLAHAILLAAALESQSTLPTASRSGDAPRPVDVACALAALLEERDILVNDAARSYGVDATRRLQAMLSSEPDDELALSRWRRARQTFKELRSRARRLLGSTAVAALAQEANTAVERDELEADDAEAFAAEAVTGDSSLPSSRSDGGSMPDVPDAASAANLAAMLKAKQTAKAQARQGKAKQDQDEGRRLPSGLDVAAELAAGAFFERIAQRQAGRDNTFLLANGRQASFASAMDALCRGGATYLVALALDGSTKRQARIQMALPITLDELRRAIPERFVCADESYLAPSDGSVRAKRVERLGAIEISALPLPAPPAGSRTTTELLMRALRERGLRRALFGGETTVAGGRAHPALELAARVRLMRNLEPDGDWPCWSEDSLLDDAPSGWLAPALQAAGGLKQLAAADTAALLLQSLPYEMQRRLQESVPESLQVPSGSVHSLSYVAEGDDPLRSGAGEGAEEVAPAGDGAGNDAAAADAARLTGPVLACKLQEWFGASETPRVGPRHGRTVPVLLHLLSPAGRPLAITSDLPSFWAGPYLQVRADVRHKYKKHPWPEEPATSAPTRLTNRAIREAEPEGGPEGNDGKRGGGKGGGGKAKKKKAKGGKGSFPLKRGPFKR